MPTVIRPLAVILLALTVTSGVSRTPAVAGDQSNLARAKSIYSAFVKGDAAAILAAVSPEVRWEVVGRRSDCPCMGVRTGKAGVKEFLYMVGDTYHFTEFTPKEFHVSGDIVFVLGYYAARNKKTNKSYSSDWIHVQTFRDGKLVSFREFLDTASEAEAARP